MEKFSRVKTFIGQDKLSVLLNSHVAVFGIGGVGGFTAEALVRTGVGQITIIDSDQIDLSNINRQIISTTKNVGQDKVQALKVRLEEINPNVKVNAIKKFFLSENSSEIDFSAFDYVIDAVDTVSAKLEIIRCAKDNGVPVISCMGMGGKTDITKIKVADIEKTKVCALARVMRRELNKRQIKGVKAVYSEEEYAACLNDGDGVCQKKADGRGAPPSLIFVPATAGLMLARETVFHLIGE